MYSRLIAWLKLLLPLGALALLSTIFMYARGPDPISSIPILENGTDPSQSEQIGKPFYAGTTENGHALTLSARQARVGDDSVTDVFADDLRAILETEEGTMITIDATLGQMGNDDALKLRNGVTLTSSSGYTVQTGGLNAAIDRVNIDSTGPVDATGPGLTLSAGRLMINESDGGDDIHLLFSDGVKLVYVPQREEAQE